MIRTLIVDDEELFRKGISLIVESGDDTTVVGEAANGLEAVTFIDENRGEVDVVLMDLQMPTMNGVDATREISELPDSPSVLILATDAQDNHVYDAIMVGASSLLLKDTPAESLLTAITSTFHGTAVVSPQMARQLFTTIPPKMKRPELKRDGMPGGLSDLTDREVEVLGLIGQGLNNAEIADELFIAEVTVKTHVGRVLRKLDLRDRIQGVVFAHENGLVDCGRVAYAAAG